MEYTSPSDITADTITLICPSCGGKTSFVANSDRLVCDYCGNQHYFQLPTRRTATHPIPTQPQPTPSARPAMPRPREVNVEMGNQSLTLTWRWFSLKFVPLAFFCIAWDSFLCFWYSMAFSTAAPWIMIVFPIAHLAVGVGLTYYTLAGFLNRTTLQIDGKTFRVLHDPLPWLGEVKVPVTNLDQLYCKEKRSSESNPTYQLVARLKDGRKLDLVSDLDSPDVAIFLEQQIESWLCIPDQPVGGEMPR